MPATKVQQATSTGAAPALSGVVQGNFVYLFSHAFRSASVTAETAATDSNGTVTTQDRLAVASGPDGILAAAYYVPNANAGTHTFTCQNFGAGAQERAVFEFSGVEQSANPLDVKTSNSTTVAGATSVATGTTGATGQADELILVGATLGGSPGVLNVGWTDPISGFTSLAKFSNDSTDIAGLTNFKNVAATGTQTATFNWTDNTATPQGAIALIGAYRNALSASISPLQSAKPRMIVRQHVGYDSIPQASNLYQPLAPVDNTPQPTGGTNISPLSAAKPKVIKFTPPTIGPMPAHSQIATGQAVAASAWSSQGDSTASWTGSSTAASAWSSSGDATATWIGASLAASVWSASGDGTATWVGASKAASVWSSTGDSTATWIGAARGAGVWSASGDSAASWTGASTAVSVWSSAGDSSASWTGGSLAAGVWSATGDASAAWAGTSGGNVWSAAGDSVAQWVGAAGALSIWSASGDSLALFVGTSLFDGANELGAKPLGHGLRKRKLRHVPAKLKDQHPDDIERERRMLEQYIATLKPQRARRGKAAPAKAVTPAPVVTPRLSEAMASLATMQELARISRANQVAEEDRRKAERERQRRRAAAVLLMMSF